MKPSRSFLLLFLLSLAAVSLYGLTAFLQNGTLGLPLDDAWIHQVYARNLGTRLEFAFFPGEPSTGSTSPLWAFLLAVGYALRLAPWWWAMGLGVVLLAGAGWMAGRAASHLTTNARVARWFVPLFLVLEWHMVWAAASGMEILLFIFLALLFVERYWSGAPVWLLGVIAGLLTLTRPEGIVLAALIAVGLALDAWSADKAKGGAAVAPKPLAPVISLGIYFAVIALVLAPYLWFNYRTNGALLPNTFYAKSAEYASLTEQGNLVTRWLNLYRQPLTGAQLLLAPGLLFLLYELLKARRWAVLVPAAWLAALPALYAWRLPVDYQFGRYMMPIIPWLVLFGVVGTAALLPKLRARAIRRAWAVALVVLLGLFLLLGANAYAQAVGIVNCEMVAAARWTREHVPPGALIAAHDIGAQGYFDSHPILDLAGLVSPEVIPFLRDEPRLDAWMRERGARYAVFFPTWYATLGAPPRYAPLFTTDCTATQAAGEENLRVYELR